MEEQQRQRVVVCGGGVIGVCTAYFLAKKGAAVTLVEKSSIACAASGKAGGFLAIDWCDGGPLSSLARASFNLHRSLAQDLDGPQSYGYRPLTTLSITITESQTPHPQNPTQSLPSWVDGPARNPRTIGTTNTTAQVHPGLFTRTLLTKAVEEHGVEVVIGKLESVAVEGGGVRAALLEGGREIVADAVVLALGPWSGKLSILSSIFRVYGLKAHSIVLEPKEPGAISPHALFLTYYAAQGGKPMDPEVYPRPTEMEIDSNSVENPLLNESEEVEEPKRGMCFTSKQEAYTFYAKYAKHVGFSIACKTQVIGDDGELRYFGIECSRSGKRIKKSEVNPLKPSLSTKIDCKARVRASLQKDGRFMLTTVNLEHNHDLIPTDSRHFAMNKKILSPVKRRLEINDQAGIGVSRNYNSMVVEAGGYESLTFDERDARNYIERARKLRLGEGDSDALQKYFLRMHAQNSSFYYMIDVDTDFRIRNLFWADAMSRAAYEEFGDVVSFDTTYLTNKYDMPFAPFVGVNHHGQSILLGCGLLSSEDTDTFVWLFKSWLNCMSDHPPKAIITDQCKAMQKAIEIVFPNARHRWCLWHIMKKIPEKLKGYSQYESMKMDLQNAVYDTFTKDEFEMKWKEMIAKFNLYENQWLGVLYDERHRWVPVYVKDIFWAGMSTTQRSESMNAFFDGYVNPKTTLKQFVEQYDNALRSKVEKEKKADFKSRHKVFDCLTVYGFEKQFQDAYTNAKFKEVQAEMKRLVYCQPFLVKEEGSICTYFVKEAVVVFGKMKHVDFVVYCNSTEFDVQCMCRLFEFRGIMCAHSLVVLIARCINEVPNKYIIPRWRKNLDRGYTCIKTTYTGFGDDFNAKVYDKMNRKLIGIVQFAGNSEGKIKLIDCGLDEIKAKVMKDDEGGGSNVAPSTSNVPPITSNVPSSPIGSINRKAISHTKLLSPLVARRKGRPVTKRKVAKVDQIVNRLKASKRKHNKSKGTKVIGGEGEGQCQSQSQPERSARRELYPYMIGMENSMCVPGHMVNAIGGTSLTPASVDIMRGQSFMNAPTQIYGVGTSLSPSDCIGRTPGFMTTQQSSVLATHQIYGAVPSSVVDLNVHMDRNDHGGSFC